MNAARSAGSKVGARRPRTSSFPWLLTCRATTVESVTRVRVFGLEAGVHLGLALLLQSGSAIAETPSQWGPPWHEPPMVPLPATTRSVEVDEFDTAVWNAPNGSRRGSLQAGARLAIYGSRRASGKCAARWFLVGPLAWVCGEHVHPSSSPPTLVGASSPREGLPYRYYFAGADGAFAYSALSLVGEGIPDSQLEPGFAVAAVKEATVNGQRNVLTTNGLWIPVSDLTPVRGSSFEGVALDDGEASNVAWVVARPVSTSETPFGKRLRKLAPLTSLRITQRSEIRSVVWLGTDQGDWVRASEVRLPRPAPPPARVGAKERWLDVDTSTQILTAYVGSHPVFATLVSTGRGAGDSTSATPAGEHRIWVKLASSDMTNVEDRVASQYYAIEAVPWVQFFKAGYGLHAAFWHEEFGTPRSHGCVNLSPRDAAFLFEWTAPRLPPGWHAVHPTSVESGTLVRVR